MSDHSPPPPSGALHQIYALAAARWRFWDANRAGKGMLRAPAPAPRASSPRRGPQNMPPTPGSSERGQEGRQARTEVTPAERSLAVRMRKAGKSLREISQALNRSVSTVSRILQQDASQAEHAGQGRRGRTSEATPGARAQGGSLRAPQPGGAGEWRSKPAPPPTSADVQELHARITRLESSLTALASAVQALAQTRGARGKPRRS